MRLLAIILITPFYLFAQPTTEIPKVIYGTGCGVSGTPPKTWLKMTSAVQQKDTALFKSWLYSLNHEYEAYGATGIFFLQQLSIPLSEKLTQRAKAIREIERPLNVCSGCTYHISSNHIFLNKVTLLDEFNYYNEAGFFAKNPHKANRKYHRKQKRELKRRDKQASKTIDIGCHTYQRIN